MSYEIEWSTPALRQLRKLDTPTARRITIAVTRLKVEPRPPGVRAVVGQPVGTMRLRVGDYRIVYVIEDDRICIVVVRVGHRCEVYRNL